MMKSFLKWMSGTIAVILLLALPVSKVQAQDDYVSYQTFYDDLSPYGQWVNDPEYGNVWVPDAGNDFRPYYTNGYWAMTDYGNTWVSNYDWGWAPFHYGRWTYNPFYGWVWIPGNTWGPAWVSWRWGGGQCGWAPMGPGISVSMSVGNYGCPSDWWVFVGPQYMYQQNFHSHWRGPRYNNTYINNTTIINNTYNNTYVYGPRANQIEQVTHQRVNTHHIGRGGRGATTVNNNTVNIYRPGVRGNMNDARPRNVVAAPRAVGSMQGGVRNTKTEFKNMSTRGELKPVSQSGRGNNNAVRQQPGREQQFDGRPDRNNTQVRPATNERGRLDQVNRVDRDRQQMQQPQRIDRPQQQTQERPRMDRPQQQMQPDRQRQQMQERQNIDRQPQRVEPRQQMQQPQRIERQRVERPQMQQPQRMEQRQQMQQPQRVERQQPQRMEQRQQMQQPQRVERQQPQRMEQRQQMQQNAPRPQPQMQRLEQRQSAPQSRPGGDDRRGRR
jgi:hypothetical protein